MNMIKNLQQLQVNGIIFPCTERSFSFSHEQETHKFIYRDEAIIESLGRQNPTYTYSIPFFETLGDPYRNLFTIAYPRFLKECQKGERVLLVDPIHGEVWVKCVSISESLSAETKSGVKVEASFVKSPNQDELPDDAPFHLSALSVAEEIRRFGEEIEPVEVELQIERTDSGLDPFSALAGVLDQLDVAQNKALATFDNAFDKLDRLEHSIKKAKSPRLNRAEQRVKRAKVTMSKVPSMLGLRYQDVLTYTVKYDMDVSSLANVLNNTVQELIELNAWIARTPQVKVNALVRYVKRDANPVTSLSKTVKSAV